MKPPDKSNFGRRRPACRPGPPRRPRPTAHTTTTAEQRLRDQAYANQTVRYSQSYRLLVYLGLEHETAMTVRRTVVGR